MMFTCSKPFCLGESPTLQNNHSWVQQSGEASIIGPKHCLPLGLALSLVDLVVHFCKHKDHKAVMAQDNLPLDSPHSNLFSHWNYNQSIALREGTFWRYSFFWEFLFTKRIHRFCQHLCISKHCRRCFEYSSYGKCSPYLLGPSSLCIDLQTNVENTEHEGEFEWIAWSRRSKWRGSVLSQIWAR